MNRTLKGNPSTLLRILVIVAAALVLIAGCSFRKKPSAVIEDLVRKTQRGEIEQAAAYMSQGFVSRQGIDNIKESIRQAALWIKREGGIKSLEILKEDTVGDVAEVTIKITRGGGDSSVIHYRLIWEQGDWKIDAIASEPTSPGTGNVNS